MAERNFSFYGKQAIIYSVGVIPETSPEIVESGLFSEVLSMFLESLREKKSSLLRIFPPHTERKAQDKAIHDVFRLLSVMDIEAARKARPDLRHVLSDASLLHELSERLYNFWRHYERFFVCHSVDGLATPLDQKPYRTFNDTIARLNHMTRKVYRDVCENITGDHPRIYRQVAAGCQLGVIASDREWPCPHAYKSLAGVPFIRQVYMSPPLILDPPMNKRDGFFDKVDRNPLDGVEFSSREWLCYPAKVCDTVIHIFFHARFMGLGVSLANLFELADDADLDKKPDAIYAYGVPESKMKEFGKNKTVFYEDTKNGIMIGAVPGDDEYGYFGYLKKMVLTLHNSIAIRKGMLPVHGAMVRIEMRNGKSANVVIWGDTGAGKSETLEAFRVLGDQYIRGMKVVFDDMGTLKIRNGKVVAYGTETGAFVRLDDLQPGFAFGNIDRAIIHCPQKINARVIIPVTTQEEVTAGHPVDFLLYANNYQEVNQNQKILEKFSTATEAMRVFREGSRMAKGTTKEKGIVTSYFANPFGPLQYEKEYEKLAEKYFDKIFVSGTYVGQLRTRLGVQGFESKGPEDAAKELFSVISKMK